jgi:hypothetical protein
MDSFWKSVKDAFAKFVSILSNKEGEEGIISVISGKAAAISVGVLGFVLLLLPVNSPQIMTIGDNLIRTAVLMWNGG